MSYIMVNSSTANETSSSFILLRPRPYDQFAGALLLLPLLPQPKPLKPLPAEIWSDILGWVLHFDNSQKTRQHLLTVCKAFKVYPATQPKFIQADFASQFLLQEITLPLVYSHVSIPNLAVLETFHKRLHTAEQKWDSIRRIPYSTPGRWVQSLDLSELSFTSQPQALLLDNLLTALFPLLPFLSRFSMNPSFVPSRRALKSLGEREGALHLRIIDGLSYVSASASPFREDHLVSLLRCCPNIEELEVIGHGPDPAELDFLLEGSWFPSSPEPEAAAPLDLQKLHTLTLLSMHSSPLLSSLLVSPLPSLRKLSLTPYDDLPYPTSSVTQLIQVHGSLLRSLLLYTPKSWPTRLHPSPETLLEIAPNLRHLSLEVPIPSLVLKDSHPLQILSIPRPTMEAWDVLEALFPHLPSLHVVRMRDVRWLRKGMNSRAQEAGVQGEMRKWTARLARRRIRVLDAEWNGPE